VHKNLAGSATQHIRIGQARRCQNNRAGVNISSLSKYVWSYGTTVTDDGHIAGKLQTAGTRIGTMSHISDLIFDYYIFALRNQTITKFACNV